MKLKRLLASALLVSSCATFAATTNNNSVFRSLQTPPQHHFYVGAGAGWGRNNVKRDNLGIPVWSKADFKKGSWAASAFFGYNFDRYLAAEVGYMYFNGAKVNVANNTTPPFAPLAFNRSERVHTHMVDLMGRVNVPLSQYITAYAKGGFAWVHRTGDIEVNGTKIVNVGSNKFRPIAAIGVDYNINRDWSVGASYTHLFGDNKVASYDALMANVTYHFS